MIYTLDSGKTITIPDADIAKIQKNNGVSYNEAVYAWLVDEEYIEDETVDELSEKAKQNIKRYEKSDKERKKSTRERKVDENKAYLLQILMNAIKNEYSITGVKNEAEFAFSMGEDNYTVKLIKHRPPKK